MKTGLSSAARCALAAALLVAAPVRGAAPDLPRKAALGLTMAQGGQPGGGAVADQILPGLTAEALGIRKGDRILEAGGRPVDAPAAVVAYAGALVAGASVDLKIRRDGKEMRLRGKAVGRPLESYRNARVDYGAVPFRGGHLRDLLVTPDGVAQPPVLFLLQGYSCASIEPASPAHPYRRLAEELIARGIAYYRVEKPGLGDSAGTLSCFDIDYATELDAFRSAYTHLVEARGIDPDRIFMLGHSLGGLQAPMLAAERPPRGVAAYGTVVRNWADYHHDVDTFQSYLFSADDPGQSAATAEVNREVFRRFYFGREAPAAIAAAGPQAADALRGAFSWDGGVRALGRSYKFLQDLAHQPIIAAWRDTRSNVLGLYGESDVVALFDTDHRFIADIANWYRPGSGRYVEVAGTDHAMGKVGDRFALREKTIANRAPPTGPFNAEIADILAGWIRESMAKPPVRTLPTRPAAAPAGDGE